MTDNRLQCIIHDRKAKYAEGGPLILEAYAIYFDTVSGNCIAQLKFFNIDPRPVKAVQIEIEGLDAFNSRLPSVGYQFFGLSVNQGYDFGSRTAISLGKVKAADCKVYLKAVSFVTDVAWEPKAPMPFLSLPETKAVNLSKDLAEQYKRDLAAQKLQKAAAYTPQNAFDLWQCGCGTWQYSNTACYICGATPEVLTDAMRLSTLQSHLESYKKEQEEKRLAEEEQERIRRMAQENARIEQQKRQEEEFLRRERVRQAEETRKIAAKKRRRRLTAVFFATLLVATGARFAARYYLIPQHKYSRALSMMEEGDFDSAINAFSELFEYSDSEYRVEQAKANKYYAAREYDQVIKIYATLPKKYQTHASVYTEEYERAVALMDSGKYDDAVTVFVMLGDYSDSKSMVQEAYYRKAEYLAASGDYDSAISIYNVLTDYKDCNYLTEKASADKLYASGDIAGAYAVYMKLPEKYQSHAADYAAMYESAIKDRNNGKFDEAVRTFTAMGAYKDSALQISATIYEKAGKLAAEKSFDSAISLYKSLGAYGDSASLAEKTTADKLYDSGDIAGAYNIYSKLALSYQTHASDYEDLYQTALQDMNGGNYDNAVSIFSRLGTYKDSSDMIPEVRYRKAAALAAAGSYDSAIALFKELGNYRDSKMMLEKASADKLYDSGLYAAAYEIYALLDMDYNTHDADYEAMYSAALQMLEKGEYDKAVSGFRQLGNYSDSVSQITKAMRAKADYFFNSGEYDNAAGIYIEIKDEAKYHASLYAKGEKLRVDGFYDNAEAIFASLGEYSDSAVRVMQVNADRLYADGDLAEAADIYSKLSEKYQTHSADYAAMYESALKMQEEKQYDEALDAFRALGSYRDSSSQISKTIFLKATALAEEEEYGPAITLLSQLEQTEEVMELEYALAQTCYDREDFESAVRAYTVLGQYKLSLSRLPVSRYAWADQLFKNKHFYEAAEQFELAGNVSDSKERKKDSVYHLAYSYLENKEYDKAKSVFSGISGYKDAAVMVKECDYRKAIDYLEEGKSQEALQIFTTLGNYSDSNEKRLECYYSQAEALFSAGKYAEAKLIYDNIRYLDSIDKSNECVFRLAEDMFAASNYTEAARLYASLNYKNSAEKAKLCLYKEAEKLYDNGQFAAAEKAFQSIADYSDSADRAKESCLQQGNALMLAGDYQGALSFFETVDYGDSTALAAKCHYEMGYQKQTRGDVDGAVAEYAYAVSLQETQDALLSIARDYARINEMKKAIQTLWLLREQDNAKQLLIQFGAQLFDQKQFNLSLLAFTAAGDHTLTELHKTLSYVTPEAIMDFSRSCTLLPKEKQFSPDILLCYANALFDTGAYDHAITVLKTIADYGNSSELLNECLYQKGIQLLEGKRYDEALTVFRTIQYYKDVESKVAEANEGIAEIKYVRANTLLSRGEFAAAYDVFSQIINYKDSKYLLDHNEGLFMIGLHRRWPIGSSLKIGVYNSPTKNNRYSGEIEAGAEIEWQILQYDGKKALVCTVNHIGKRSYNNNDEAATNWSKCWLRKWLNGTFFKETFSSKEQKIIFETKLSNPSSSKVSGGPDTTDKVFISDKSIKGHDGWAWIRMPHDYKSNCTMCENGHYGNAKNLNPVYPMMWIDLAEYDSWTYPIVD